MIRLRRASLLAAAVLAAPVGLGACTDDEAAPAERADAAETTTTTALVEAPLPPPVAEAVELRLAGPERTVAGPVTWQVTVTNTSPAQVTLTFATGQQGEVVVRDGEDEVHRWSTGRFFDQVVSTTELAPGAATTLSFPDDLTGLPPGRYTVEVALTNTDPPEPAEARVRVSGPPE